MWIQLMLLALALSSSEMTPSCSSRVFCQGQLLHLVQSRQVLDDINFVRMKLLRPEEEILRNFEKFMLIYENNPTNMQLREFVYENFEKPQNELELWIPTDFDPNPPVLKKIQDLKLKQFAKDVIDIWPELGRKISSHVIDNNHLYTLAPVPNGFIIPGGIFEELYYWDSYWIIKGLIVSNMTTTAKGMIENLLSLVHMYGFVPNGSRSFFASRSQPPLLTAMAELYVQATNDLEWLEKHIETLINELDFWIRNRMIVINIKGKERALLRYYADSLGPRSESYIFDYTQSSGIISTEKKQFFYTNIKSAAESGWDFSSRWFITENGTNEGTLLDIQTQNIVPVDLNAFFAGALQTISDFWFKLGRHHKSIDYAARAKKWRETIDEVFWNNDEGIWFDYDLPNKKQRKYFYASNFAPLWSNAVEKSLVEVKGQKVINYLKRSGALGFSGGIPTSMYQSGHQWDLPNVWPPLQSMVIGALKAINTKEANDIARHEAELWISSNYLGYMRTGQMFEKYDAFGPGKIGGGGEYTAQTGFGWTNGVILELLNDFGDSVKLRQYMK